MQTEGLTMQSDLGRLAPDADGSAAQITATGSLRGAVLRLDFDLVKAACDERGYDFETAMAYADRMLGTTGRRPDGTEDEISREAGMMRETIRYGLIYSGKKFTGRCEHCDMDIAEAIAEMSLRRALTALPGGFSGTQGSQGLSGSGFSGFGFSGSSGSSGFSGSSGRSGAKGKTTQPAPSPWSADVKGSITWEED